MILFRLVSFVLRIIGSFFFVFLLQIQFAGKTLESYLNDFGKKFIVTRTLQKVSQDGVKVIKGSPSEEDKSEARQVSSSTAVKYIKDFAKKISLPSDSFQKDEDDSSK